jgi:hypothetical protein
MLAETGIHFRGHAPAVGTPWPGDARAGNEFKKATIGWPRARRSSGGKFRQQQGIVGGIDDAAERDAALRADEAVTLEPAFVDVGRAAPGKRQPRGASRAGDRTDVRSGAFFPQAYG